MHTWGQLDSQGRDICCRVGDAAEYIGSWLRKWARIDLTWKEKYGTVRIYCSFGCNYPILNKILVPIQKYLYVWRYKKAIEKWPDLYVEILAFADWNELFEGKILGYNRSDYWRKG